MPSSPMPLARRAWIPTPSFRRRTPTSYARRRPLVGGVPSFVYAGKLYWGQDRMYFLRSAVLRKSTLPS
jgi:2-hydroxychromene-2-carboxylate isomerase